MTAQPADTTVAIVGAGPAGLVIAHVLQRAGIDFVVLERHAQSDMGSMAKAGAIDYRTVEALKSVGIADRILSSTRPTTAASSVRRRRAWCSTTERSPATGRTTSTRSTSSSLGSATPW